jgi:hypothetical protein|nr:MAG TPA: hypothetical protein [Caudoviricetes sp.]
MQKFIFEHLIEDGEEKIFDSEKDAIKYALTMHSNYTGDMVVVEVDVSAKQLAAYKSGVPIPCTTYRKEVWTN